MKKSLIEKLVAIAKERQTKDDQSHDFDHISRVLGLARKLAKKEGGDLEIIIPAVLFHDTVVYRKDTPQSKNETDESAEMVTKILSELPEYPQEKVSRVATCIRECSFSKGIVPKTIEGKILQDADRLESTGAISIMRTFASTGQMGRSFYFPDDPFRQDPPASDFALDLFPRRLLKIAGSMRTPTGTKMALRRDRFLRLFLKQTQRELKESGILDKKKV